MRDLKVWLRIGDNDNYHDFDSVDEAANFLHDYLGATINDGMPFRRYVGGMLVGIEIPNAGYLEKNAISLYWGDDDAWLVTPLSDYELGVFERTVHAG